MLFFLACLRVNDLSLCGEAYCFISLVNHVAPSLSVIWMT